MNPILKENFLDLWKKYFGNAELPIVFYYSDGDGGAQWAEKPKAIIGMFDPSARPCVPQNVLTFAVPMKRFERMTGYMEESFLLTETWSTVRKRITKSK